MNKGDAHRVISALKNADFYGKRVYAEVAVIDKDYQADSEKGKKRASRSQIVDTPRNEKRNSHRRTRFEDADFERPAKKSKNKRNKEKADKNQHGSFDTFMKKKRK